MNVASYCDCATGGTFVNGSRIESKPMYKDSTPTYFLVQAMLHSTPGSRSGFVSLL